jgi:hypothetical protein
MAATSFTGSANIHVERDGSGPRLYPIDIEGGVPDMQYVMYVGDVKVWASSPETMAAWFASMSGWLLDQSDSERAA